MNHTPIVIDTQNSDNLGNLYEPIVCTMCYRTWQVPYSQDNDIVTPMLTTLSSQPCPGSIQ